MRGRGNAGAAGGRPPAALVASALAALAVVSCSGPSSRDVRATVLTESGDPVPGAVFYAEAWDDDGPFAFLTMVTGTAGEVPQSAREASKIAWRPGARIALAAFAPGYVPTVARNPGGSVRSDGALLVLHPAAGAGGAWNPAIADFAFPFPDTPDLAAEARTPGNAALRQAFRAAWDARDRENPLTEAERRKVSLLATME